MLKPKFIHLNVHTDYSIKDGLCKIDNILNKIKEINVPSIAITDFFSLSVIIKFVKLSYILGIKPIIGVDIYMYYRNVDKEFIPLTLLVMNSVGYNNLVKLISKSYKFNFNRVKPSIYYRWLVELNDGLIFLFSVEKSSDVHEYLIFNDFSLIKKKILFWKKYIKDRLYFQISRIGLENENRYIETILDLSYLFKLSLVATNKVLFLNKNDFYIHEIRCAIYYGYSLNKVRKVINYTKHQYLKTDLEMCTLFTDIPESLINSVEISKRCNFVLEKKKIILPSFFLLKKKNINKYFVSLLFKKIRFFFSKDENKDIKKNIYIKRLKKELKIIIKMNFPNYFLIVMEFVNWAKKNNISVGPGRGSGNGSLVAFLLNIIDINPLKFNLLFERFLNPEREIFPDLDIDFCMNKRDKVLDHIEKLYGWKSVSQIVTFNTMTAKSVIRDVGRVLGYSYNYIDYIAKLIPYDLNITLKKALVLESRLNDLYINDNEVTYLIDVCFKLEGIIKGIGKHAGGIVISPTFVIDFCPIYLNKENRKLITQFDKDDIEYVGLIKFDLLGLRTLTVINNTLKNVNSNLSLKNKINILNIPLWDVKSFSLLNKAKTTAVFQLESNGMKNLITRLKPNSFEDIVALLALFRPGPLQSGMVDNFINRKNGKESISYPDYRWQHDLLKPVLKNTYGIILYQEQVMQISRVLANYSLGKADLLRVAISKKDNVKMNLHKKIFIKRALNIGITFELSSKIFSFMEKFSSYGFNKSHSVAYAFIAYQTLWLKSHYPSEFLVSVINADIDNTNKIMLIIDEAKSLNIKIIPPNINWSNYYFTINNKKNIIYGIGAIKGIGRNSIKYIINIRNTFGLFKSFIDFCILTFSKIVTRLVLEKLILAGCFDLFKINRSILFYYLKEIILFAKYNFLKFSSKQLDMFNFREVSYKSLTTKLHCSPKWTNSFLLNKEREVLGLYVSDHPINIYNNIIKKYNLSLTKIRDIYLINKKVNLLVLGVIIKVKILFTKNKNYICLILLNDDSSNLEVLMFKEKYIEYYSLIKENNVIIVSGFLNYKNNRYSNVSLLANKIKLLKFKF